MPGPVKFAAIVIGLVVICGLGACGPVPASAEASAKRPLPPAEFLSALDELEPMAAPCAGDESCFAELARPFGPLWFLVDERTGAADIGRANDLQNFAYGTFGAMAGVDPMKMANEFHCGPPCTERRKAELLPALPQTRDLVKTFEASGLQVVALWPDERVRADDDIYAKGRWRRLPRTPELGVLRTGAAGEVIAAGPDQANALQIAEALRRAGVVAVVREPFGGVRVIHHESLGDNETGLLFIAPDRAREIDDRQLPDGGRYLSVEAVADGIYFYLRT